MTLKVLSITGRLTKGYIIVPILKAAMQMLTGQKSEQDQDIIFCNVATICN